MCLTCRTAAGDAMHAINKPSMFHTCSDALLGNEPGTDIGQDQDHRPRSNVRVSVHGDRSTSETTYIGPRNWEGGSSPGFGCKCGPGLRSGRTYDGHSPPQAGDRLHNVLQWCSLNESKSVFCQLSFYRRRLIIEYRTRIRYDAIRLIYVRSSADEMASLIWEQNEK